MFEQEVTHPVLWLSDEQLDKLDNLPKYWKENGCKNISEFSALCGMRKSMIENILSWNVIPTRCSWNRIARVFGLPLEKEEEEPEAAPVKKPKRVITVPAEPIKHSISEGRVYFRLNNIMLAMGYTPESTYSFKLVVGKDELIIVKENGQRRTIYTSLKGVKDFIAIRKIQGAEKLIAFLEAQERSLLNGKQEIFN